MTREEKRKTIKLPEGRTPGGKVIQYDDDISFDLPENCDITYTVDDGGGWSIQIGLNPREENGQYAYDRKITVCTVETESEKKILDVMDADHSDPNYLHNRYDTSPTASLICSESNMPLFKLITRLFMLNIEVSNSKALSLRMSGGGKQEKADEYDQELSQLFSVWPTVLIHGKQVTVEKNYMSDFVQELNKIRDEVAKKADIRFDISWKFENQILTIGDRWQIKLPSGWNVLEETSEDENKTKLKFFAGGNEIGDLKLGNTVNAQDDCNFDSTIQYSSPLANGSRVANEIILGQYDNMIVGITTYLAQEEPFLVDINIKEKEPDEIDTHIYFKVDCNQDVQEALQKISDGDFEMVHPLGSIWPIAWGQILQAALSIAPIHDPTKPLLSSIEIRPQSDLSCRIPEGLRQLCESNGTTSIWYPAKGQPSEEDLQSNSYDYYIKVETAWMDIFGQIQDRALRKPVLSMILWKTVSPFSVMIHEHIYENAYVAVYMTLLNDTVAVMAAALTPKGMAIVRVLTDTGKTVGELAEMAISICDSIKIDGSGDECCDKFYPFTPDIFHEHYDLVESGSYTTHRSADFIGQSIRMLMEKYGNEDDDAYDLMEISDDEYNLDEKAIALAKVFRLDEKLFEPYKDTEALIRKGMVMDARSLQVLRSLAWGIQGLAARQGKELSEYTYEELMNIGEYIHENNNLIYDGFSFAVGLVNHYDWHVFYVPNSYLMSEDKEYCDLRYATNKDDRGGNIVSLFIPGVTDPGQSHRLNSIISRNEETLSSLEALRDDLEALLPIMETIHDGLLIDRNRSQKLEGPLADALIAWCALAIAAKEPFYSEEAADTYEADAALEEPLERPTDVLDDKPMR